MNNFKLCVSLSENNFAACYNVAREVEFAELRLDSVQFTEKQIEKLFSLKTKFIATCRYGGKDNTSRKILLKKAINAGAGYVDIEIDADTVYQKEMLAYAKKKSCKTIVSYHNFTETPRESDLQEIIRQSTKLNPWKIKIATMANTMQDVATILSLYRNNTDLIAFCMGEKGKISRVASLFLGAEFTFVSPAKGQETAKGQIDKETMITLIEKLNETSND